MCAIMSSSRWESSQRPLFVKSVWMNGYRHAILSKEDPAVKSKSASSSTRSRSGKEPSSARSKSKSSSAGEALMIPTVQLLLANVHRLKQGREIKSSRPRQKLVKSFTLNVISTEHLTGKLKKETTEARLSSKSKQVKTSYCYSSQNSDQKLCNERLEHCGASLTERVLLWLDLAGRFTNEMCTDREEQENKIRTRVVRKENKRHATAHPHITEQKNSTCPYQPANNDRTFVRRCTKNPNVKREDAEEATENETVGVETFEDFSILKGGQRKLQLRNAMVESHREENLVMSQIEVVSIAPSKKSDHSSVKKYPKACCKRQVHIFMPLVAKRMTECNNSVISESNDSSVMK